VSLDELEYQLADCDEEYYVLLQDCNASGFLTCLRGNKRVERFGERVDELYQNAISTTTGPKRKKQREEVAAQQRRALEAAEDQEFLRAENGQDQNITSLLPLAVHHSNIHRERP